MVRKTAKRAVSGENPPGSEHVRTSERFVKSKTAAGRYPVKVARQYC
jgi:hypothetical protein